MNRVIPSVPICDDPVNAQIIGSAVLPVMQQRDTGETTPLLCKQLSQINATELYEAPLLVDNDEINRSKPSVSSILPVFFLYCLAIGAIAVPKLNIILNLICYQYHLDPTSRSDLVPTKGLIQQCQTSTVQSHMTRFILFANVISGCICAFTSPRLGALSDQYGRKKIMAFTATGMLLGDVITIVVALLPDKISVYWILLEFAFGGLAGTFVATMAIVQSYAADCTSHEDRATAFGRLHACAYAGAAAGPVLGGLFVEYATRGNILPLFYLAAGCHAVFVLFVLFFLPESLTGDMRRIAKAQLQQTIDEDPRSTVLQKPSILSTIGLSIFRPLSIFLPQTMSYSTRLIRRNLNLLAAIDTIVFGAILSITHILILYSTYAFSLKNLQSSGLISITNTSRVIALMVILPLLSRITAPITIIRMSLFIATMSTFLLAISPNFTLFTVFSAISAFSALASPTLQATLTTLVPKQQTGELLGAVSLLHAMARIIIPAILDLTYGLTIDRHDGAAVFLCVSGIFGMALTLSFGVRLNQE